MNLDERLKFCRICENRKMNPAIGLVCGLTNEKPAFEGNCPDFKLDQKEADSLVHLEKEVKAEEEASAPFAREKQMTKMGVLGGVVMIVIAIVWFLLGLSYGYVYFYPFILLAIGLYALIKGLMKGKLAEDKS